MARTKTTPTKKPTATAKEPEASAKKPAASAKKPARKPAAPPQEKPAAVTDLTTPAAAAQAALEAARGAFRETSRGMYALGKALEVLHQPGMAEAAGHPSFDALCAREFDLNPQTVDRLVRAVAHVTEEAFAAMGPKRVNALLDLATVTEVDHPSAILTGEVVRLWKGGPRVHVAKLPTAKIIEHAKAARARALELGDTAAVEHTATPLERAAAEAATKWLHQQGIAATVTVRASKPGAPSEFDVVGLDQGELERLTRR
ncbi:MAG: hypothetical protein Q8S73_24885 [Deltaproteobacteria bacterium]|nr:hypothetical protein [Myxococcales bacterium]MDP3217371.1 hypothetical protein [Deltaproteobacteria bacterium]